MPGRDLLLAGPTARGVRTAPWDEYANVFLAASDLLARWENFSDTMKL